jgi:hypothetical protein
MIPEDVFVYDAVAHSYNLGPSNYRVMPEAEVVSEMLYGSFMEPAPPEYRVPPEQYLRDWSIDETAGMLFRESQTDVATIHPTPIKLYHDGQTALSKAAEAVERWPQRFSTMATVDPMDGQEAVAEFERQAEQLDPVGLKLYPSSWRSDGTYESWQMSDPDVAYPLFEKARELGIDLIAVHKALPLGPVPATDYHTEDIESAAASFPELNFSVVHAGLAYVEETAWQLARFENIYANLEVTSFLAHAAPDYWQRAFDGLFSVAGEHAADQVLWATGCSAYPAQPQLEAFWEYDFEDGPGGLFPGPEMSREIKEKILGRNYAEMLGLDVEELQAGIADDEFARATDRDGLAPAYSTTEVDLEAGS